MKRFLSVLKKGNKMDISKELKEMLDNWDLIQSQLKQIDPNINEKHLDEATAIIFERSLRNAANEKELIK